MTVRYIQGESHTKKVSVLMVTYNHEAYIAQAIESALMQITDFDYEIVIGEDCSTDCTREIVTSFACRYPNKIRPLFHETNMGANRNLVLCLEACQGQYVALLEGDDYWTVPDKLQKQSDHLDSHPESAMCFHNARVMYENRNKDPHPSHPEDMKDTWTLDELLYLCFPNTCSVMLRRGLVETFPDEYYSCVVGDWPLFAFNAQYGNIGYLTETMAVYRKHDRGMWSPFNFLHQQELNIEVLEFIANHLDVACQPLSRAPIKHRLHYLAWEHARIGDYATARNYARRYIEARIADRDVFDCTFLKLLIRVYVPAFVWAIHKYRALFSTEHM